MLIDPGCQIFRRAPGETTWTEIRAGAGNDCSLIRANSGNIYAAIVGANNSGELDVWSGTGETWTDQVGESNEIWDLQSAADGTQRVADNDGFGYIDGGSIVRVNSDGPMYNLAPVGDVIYIGNGGLTLDRYHAGHVEAFEAPSAGTIQADAAGNFYEMGNGVYRYLGTEYADRIPVDQGSTVLQVLPDGGAITNEQSDLLITDFDGGWNEINSDLAITTLSARSETDAYLTDGQALVHFDGGQFTTIDVPTPTLAALWEPPTGAVDLYVVGPAGVALAYSGGTWTTLSTPAGGVSCDLAGVTGSSSIVITVGACNGVGIVWQLSTSSATELYRGGTALVAAAITSEGHIVAAGPSGGAVFDGTTWTAEPHAAGASVAATTANDVWVGGGPDDIVHWDGSSWSRLGIEGASTPYVAATTREVYITGATEALLLR